jgi:HAMP domain-containing protein
VSDSFHSDTIIETEKMDMRLRLKILSGFLVLAVVLFVAGVGSIHELNTVGTSVQRILDDDYASIHGARMMIEALEREDSGTLLLFLGKWEEGRAILASADSLFEEGFRKAQIQESVAQKGKYLEEIRFRYSAYFDLWKRPIVGTEREGNLDWYFQELHRAFLDVKSSVNALMDYNDRLMYQTATDLRNRSNRAIMPGIIAVVAALVFTLVFNFFVNYYVVNPMVRIHRGVQNFLENRIPFEVEIETEDEIADLAEDIRRLCLRIQPEETER